MYVVTHNYVEYGYEFEQGSNTPEDMEKITSKCATGEVVPKNCVYEFRLLDDDDMVYVEGVSDDNSSLDPLDTEGVDYGCTSIMYLNYDTDTWKYL